MMDIVERLRDYARNYTGTDYHDALVNEGADEIIRLRQQVQEFERSVKTWEEDALRYHKDAEYWKGQTAHYIDAMPTEKDTEERIKYWRDTIRGELVVHYEKLLAESQAREEKLLDELQIEEKRFSAQWEILAACQAREAKLRDFAIWMSDHDIFGSLPYFIENRHLLVQPDDTALKEMLLLAKQEALLDAARVFNPANKFERVESEWVTGMLRRMAEELK